MFYFSKKSLVGLAMVSATAITVSRLGISGTADVLAKVVGGVLNSFAGQVFVFGAAFTAAFYSGYKLCSWIMDRERGIDEYGEYGSELKDCSGFSSMDSLPLYKLNAISEHDKGDLMDLGLKESDFSATEEGVPSFINEDGSSFVNPSV